MKYKIFAAIDVGSTAITMKVVQLSRKDGIKTLDYVRRNLSLGTETYGIGKISYPMLEKICSVLLSFTEIMKTYGAEDYACYATTAVREASNSEYIIDQIRLRTGMQVHILSNEEERFLSNRALFLDGGGFQSMIESSALVVDISSGTVQVTCYSGGQLQFSKNLPLGPLRVLEKLREFEDRSMNFSGLIDEYLEITTERYKKNFLKKTDFESFVFFGWEIGYIKRLCGKEDQLFLSAGDFSAVYELLSHMETDEICERYHIPFENAMLFLPCVMIYLKFLKDSEKKKIYVPNVSIIDGIAGEYAEKNGYFNSSHDFTGDILSAAEYCSHKYNCDKKHYDAVLSYARPLFQSLAKRFGLGRRDEIILKVAAILRDTGFYMSLADHSKYSYDVVKANKLLGLSDREHRAAALLTLLDESRPISDYVEYNSLTKSRKLLVSKLAAILFLAEALDAGYCRKIRRIRSVLQGNELTVTAYTDRDITLESRRFAMAANLFEEIFGIQAVLKKSQKSGK